MPGATEIPMPQMGESIFEGTIVKWLKKVGDGVQKDEPLFEISTDKVDAEIPSPTDGVLTEIKFGEGATVQVNEVVAVVGGNAAGASAGWCSACLQIRAKLGIDSLARHRSPQRRSQPRTTGPSSSKLFRGAFVAAGAPHCPRAQRRPSAHRRHRQRTAASTKTTFSPT